jgi:Tfp pilus assembly protein PilF
MTFSCINQVDFSNPKSVVEYYYSLKSRGEIELEYELLADTCKGYATFQDYFDYYSARDSLLREYDLKVEKIQQLPLDPQNPKHRLFEIQSIIIKQNDLDTIKGISYCSVFSENRRWKVVWTRNIAQAARKLMNSQKFSDAIEAYREVLKLDPLNGEAYRQIGWCQYRQNNNQDALISVKKAIEVSPKEESNYNLLAGIYGSQGNNELAIENYRKAIDMTNSDLMKVVLMANLSIEYLNLNQYNQAKITIDKALIIDPTHTHGWWQKGKIFLAEDKRDSAIICFEKAVSVEPMDDYLQKQLYYELAYQKYVLGSNKYVINKNRDKLLMEAKQYTLKALDLQHDNEQYRRLLDNINSLLIKNAL